jgi:PhoPQ-activated pathogenicity-related protein
VPNNGHGLRDFERVVGLLGAAHRHAAGDLKLPKLSWEHRDVDGGVDLIVRSDVPPKGFQVWTAASANRDFRDALWTATAVKPIDGVYHFTLPKRDDALGAVFGEARFDDDVLPYSLSTNVQIVEAK